MKTLKILIALIIICSLRSLAQTAELKKIYFLVDTARTSSPDKFVQIERNTVFNRTYHFFCRSFPYYEMDLQFSYDDHKKVTKVKIVATKPKVDYISWKHLHSLLEDRQKFFGDHYELNIVEALPNGRFVINAVTRERYQPPTKDFIILKPDSNHKN